MVELFCEYLNSSDIIHLGGESFRQQFVRSNEDTAMVKRLVMQLSVAWYVV